MASGLLAAARAVAIRGHGVGRRARLKAEQFLIVVGAQAQLDEGSRVGRDLVLPAVGGLVAGHGILRTAVPVAAGFTGEIIFADQGFLDSAGAFRLDALLAVLLPRT